MAGSPLVDKGMKINSPKEDLLTVSRETSQDGSGNPDVGVREFIQPIKDMLFYEYFDTANGLYKNREKVLKYREMLSSWEVAAYLENENYFIFTIKMPHSEKLNDINVFTAKIKPINNNDEEICPGFAFKINLHKSTSEQNLDTYRGVVFAENKVQKGLPIVFVEECADAHVGSNVILIPMSNDGAKFAYEVH